MFAAMCCFEENNYIFISLFLESLFAVLLSYETFTNGRIYFVYYFMPILRISEKKANVVVFILLFYF